LIGIIFKVIAPLSGVLFAVSNPEAAQKINDIIWNSFERIAGVLS